MKAQNSLAEEVREIDTIEHENEPDNVVCARIFVIKLESDSTIHTDCRNHLHRRSTTQYKKVTEKTESIGINGLHKQNPYK